MMLKMSEPQSFYINGKKKERRITIATLSVQTRQNISLPVSQMEKLEHMGCTAGQPEHVGSCLMTV